MYLHVFHFQEILFTGTLLMADVAINSETIDHALLMSLLQNLVYTAV